MRESKSADQIAGLINDSVRVVPGLEKTKVEVARLTQPDADGCNWAAHHLRLPVGILLESERLLKDIIRTAQRNFNLWDLPSEASI